MCIDPQHLGSPLLLVIEISGHDRNFDDPQMSGFRWSTNNSGICYFKFQNFSTKTARTWKPSKLETWIMIVHHPKKNYILIAHIRYGHFPLIIENVELHAGLHKSAVILVLI